MDQYVDGGVASNTPVSLARTVARHLDVVILDPPFEPQSYDNAVEIGLAVFGTMQQRILESEIRAAFFESLGTRDFDTCVDEPGSDCLIAHVFVRRGIHGACVYPPEENVTAGRRIVR